MKHTLVVQMYAVLSREWNKKQETELGQLIATSRTHTCIMGKKNNDTTALQVNFYERALQFVTWVAFSSMTDADYIFQKDQTWFNFCYIEAIFALLCNI